MGGNVFQADPIKKVDVKPTIKHFVSEFIKVFPKAKGHFELMRTLGSTGKKEFSGDIDLALDVKSLSNIKDWNLTKADIQPLFEKFKKRARKANDKQLMQRAVVIAIGEKLESESSEISVDFIKSGRDVLFCSYPQYSEKGKNGLTAQIDVNFGDLDWLSFSEFSGDTDMRIKGLHRTQLILSLFYHKGYSFDHHAGVSKDGKLVAKTPDQAIQLLSDLYNAPFTAKVLESYYTLQDFLKEHLSEEELHAVWDYYLQNRLDHTRCDIPPDMQEYWIDNQDRLGLQGKFLPDNSKLASFKADGSANLMEIILSNNERFNRCR